MRKITPIILAQLLLLTLLIAPQASTQGSCELDQGLRDLVGDTFKGWEDGRPAGQSKVYVSHLSFMDGVTKTLLLSEEAALIDEAVKDGMRQAASTNPNIVVNEPGHTVPNTDASVGKLAEISFNADFTPEQKYREAVSTLLEPNGVDVLISGMIVDTGTVIQVKPMGVSKPDEVIKTKDRSFSVREELFEKVNRTLTLTPKGHEEIAKAVKDLLENL
ncbi:MAG: hypothetical protein SX243_00615 [Acidobacteriota bacterium]|nr:hypothetical protein [Acidobacteriota bacterium]